MIDTGKTGIYGDYWKICAAVLFILGAISDGMDGYYARKLNIVTNSGKLWDPVADKVLVSSALIVLTSTGYVPAYATIIIIAREFFVTGLRLVAVSQNKVIAASRVAKWKTGFQLAYVITILVFISFHVLFLRYIPDHQITALFLKYRNIPIDLLLIISLFFTLYSGYDYYNRNREILR
jgi:CDP-diacylglycerol--glycerol-3-phosphate 3-phosphatidyltransferase